MAVRSGIHHRSRMSAATTSSPSQPAVRYRLGGVISPGRFFPASLPSLCVIAPHTDRAAEAPIEYEDVPPRSRR